MSSVEEKISVVKRELDKLTILSDFDDTIFDTQIELIKKRINELKRSHLPIQKDLESISTKSWADQSEEEEKLLDIPKKREVKGTWSRVIDNRPAPIMPRFSFDQLFDYPFTNTMKPTHQINFHTGTYHWVSRWFDNESNILVKTEKFVQFTLEVINNRAVLSYFVSDKIKSIKLCLMDQVITCYDQDSKPYDMKVKLLREAPQ